MSKLFSALTLCLLLFSGFPRHLQTPLLLANGNGDTVTEEDHPIVPPN